LLSQPTIIVARQIEPLNIFLGWEQANRYQLNAPDGAILGYLLEEEASVVSTMSRQLLRTHRPFRAIVMSPAGDVLLRIRRPFSWINSRIYVIGEAQQEWALMRRRYNLFLRRGGPDGDEFDQFGRIDSGFLAWDFTVRDEANAPIGKIDRNFVGFAQELFTDTGQYALHFE
ncbi:uncharacterized protein RHOBADRAFT_7793, partial [Rhodotorula graminis WP1]